MEEKEIAELSGEALISEFIKVQREFLEDSRAGKKLQEQSTQLFERWISILENMQKETQRTEFYFRRRVPAIERELAELKEKELGEIKRSLKSSEMRLNLLDRLFAKREAKEAYKCMENHGGLCENFPERWRFLLPQSWIEADKPKVEYIKDVFCIHCENFREFLPPEGG